jgi:segregation and condensation protein A
VTKPDATKAGPGVVKAKAPDATPETQVAEQANAYRVALPAFEGPLDLLLHRIQKHELDILNIPIGFVTEKYVDYIMMMQELNIDLASEYLVMAATLAHIKSRTLLPTPPAEPEDGAEEEEDPRAELVRRLLEYQKYKLAAEQLGGRSLTGRDVFTRGVAEPVDEGPAALAPVPLFKLLDAFASVLKRVHRTQEHHIDFERISITERINQLSDVLRARPSVAFDELFAADRTRADVIVTFLALLEMTRLRLTRISQEGPYAPIHIELSVQDEDGAEGASEGMPEGSTRDVNTGDGSEPEATES